MRAADFERKQLNLVVVVDVSGSMDSPFDAYYYDGPGAQPDGEISLCTRERSRVLTAAGSWPPGCPLLPPCTFARIVRRPLRGA